MADRPIGREKEVTGKGKKIKRRGDGLGTGPVGSGHIGNEDVDGTDLVLDGKTYVVSDPTYINASVGECMPQFKDSRVEIIKF